MSAAEQSGVVRTLRSLEKRAEASELLAEMLVGQIRRQQLELGTSIAALSGAGAPVGQPPVVAPNATGQ